MSLISIKNSKVAIRKTSSFKIAEIVTPKDYLFWTDWLIEPQYTDSPDGTVISDGVSNLIIENRAALTYFNIRGLFNAQYGGAINASNCVNLNEFNSFGKRIDSANFSNCTSLSYLTVGRSNSLTNVNISGCFNLSNLSLSTNPNLSFISDVSQLSKLVVVFLEGCSLPQQSIDNILISLDNNGLLNGRVYLNGGTNAAPSSLGLQARNNLLAKGWEAFVNLPASALWLNWENEPTYTASPEGTIISDGVGSLTVTDRSALVSFSSNNAGATIGGDLNIKDLPNLTTFICTDSQLSREINASGNPSLNQLDLSRNQLSQAIIDDICRKLVENGLSNGVADFGGEANDGVVADDTTTWVYQLITSKGWEVRTNKLVVNYLYALPGAYTATGGNVFSFEKRLILDFNDQSLTSFSDSSSSERADYYFIQIPNLVNLSFYETRAVTVESNPALNSVSIVTADYGPDNTGSGRGGSLTIKNNPSLTSITINEFINLDSAMIHDFSNNALSQPTVDHILQKILECMQTRGGYLNFIYLNGGTNAAPSAAGLATINTLVNDYYCEVYVNT